MSLYANPGAITKAPAWGFVRADCFGLAEGCARASWASLVPEGEIGLALGWSLLCRYGSGREIPKQSAGEEKREDPPRSLSFLRGGLIGTFRRFNATARPLAFAGRAVWARPLDEPRNKLSVLWP